MQYQEIDFVFVECLLVEEGLFYYIEYIGDLSSVSLGMYIVVIVDYNGSFKFNVCDWIVFSQLGVVMLQDSIDCWCSVCCWQSNVVEILIWDYCQVVV